MHKLVDVPWTRDERVANRPMAKVLPSVSDRPSDPWIDGRRIAHFARSIMSPANEQNDEPCDWERIREILARVGDKWTLSVLAVLGNRRMRMKALHGAIEGIS